LPLGILEVLLLRLQLSLGLIQSLLELVHPFHLLFLELVPLHGHSFSHLLLAVALDLLELTLMFGMELVMSLGSHAGRHFVRDFRRDLGGHLLAHLLRHVCRHRHSSSCGGGLPHLLEYAGEEIGLRRRFFVHLERR